MDDLAAKYERWRVGEYDDDEAKRITDLSTNALRDAQRMGAVRTTANAGGRAKKRSWSRKALEKGAIVRATQQSGLPLPIGFKLAFHYLNTRSMWNYDPHLRTYFTKWEDLQSSDKDGFDSRENGEHPFRAWMSDEYSASREDKDFDSFIHIVNGTFVVIQSALAPALRKVFTDANHIDEITVQYIGRLVEDGRQLISWERPMNKKGAFTMEMVEEMQSRTKAGEDWFHALEEIRPKARPWSVEEDYADEIDIKFLALTFEENPDLQREMRQKAQQAFSNALTKSSINVTMAMRNAMRRALDLQVAE